MALLGSAAIIMWWDMAPDQRSEFEHWHSHEHFPERLGIEGFRRATRWTSADGGEGILVLYELDNYETVSSPQYAARLNAPTLWSTQMMPHHRHMIRCQCHALESAGGVVAQHALTVRLSPATADGSALQSYLKALATQLVNRPGCVGGHLLRHQTPPLAATTEQKIRGHDRAADWVFVVAGYDAVELRALLTGDLAADSLARAGAAPGVESGLYALSYSAMASDVH